MAVQDGNPSKGSGWGLTIDPRITVWTALDNCSIANGALQVIPGPPLGTAHADCLPARTSNGRAIGRQPQIPDQCSRRSTGHNGALAPRPSHPAAIRRVGAGGGAAATQLDIAPVRDQHHGPATTGLLCLLHRLRHHDPSACHRCHTTSTDRRGAGHHLATNCYKTALLRTADHHHRSGGGPQVTRRSFGQRSFQPSPLPRPQTSARGTPPRCPPSLQSCDALSSL